MTYMSEIRKILHVEAYTASWIEIEKKQLIERIYLSRLIQPRGLKSFYNLLTGVAAPVEAYTASWIEILHNIFPSLLYPVEAYTASWIEIWCSHKCMASGQVEAYTASWIEMLSYSVIFSTGLVEAYTASWIEIYLCSPDPRLAVPSRLIQPRGLKFPENIDRMFSFQSRLIQPRGLKFPQAINIFLPGEVEAYTVS